jgi:hypothetical protein
MILDTGTMIAIVIALASSCTVMVFGILRQRDLERELSFKNKKIMKLQAYVNSMEREKA